MSIRIDKITGGRFGNKILQYNSLVQLGKKYNVKCSMVQNNEITRFFKNITGYISSKKPVKLLTCKMILDDELLEFEKYDYKIDDPAYCLHNTFYKIINDNPRTFLKLKDEFKVDLSKNILNIGIHIRGGDIISKDGNNGREIHEFEYYKDSINYILKEHCKNKKYMFYICTDDTNFKTFQQTYNYFIEKKLPLKLGSVVGNKNQYIVDWSILSECDILINSSSTFCVTAAFLGKENKYIINSKKWFDKNINHTKWNNSENGLICGMTIADFRKTFDIFWINIINKNNKYCYCNKLI